MEQQELDSLTEKFVKEFKWRPGWVDGVAGAVNLKSIANSGTANPADFGATHPAILVEYTPHRSGQALGGLPRGHPGVVSFPKKYEKAAVVYKAAA